MFDFLNLDCIDDELAEPEWMKWQLKVPAAYERTLAVLVDDKEETFAAPDDEYVFEKLEVPFLPEEAYDPMGLADDAPNAIEDRILCYTGQVLMNYVASSHEQHAMLEYQKDERKAYIEEVYADRLAVIANAPVKPGNRTILTFDGKFDRKSFGWRDVKSPILGNIVAMPDDSGYLAEFAMGGGNTKLIKMLTEVNGTVFLPTASMISLVISLAAIVRPQPTGPRIRPSAPWHLAMTDVFFPSPFIVDDGSEYIDRNEEAPTYVHAVVMSVDKETGEIEVKNLLENIKFATAPKYPSR